MRSKTTASSKRIKGWLFDVYPSDFGEVAVWIISDNGERVRLTDKFQPKIYVSGRKEDIERLASGFFCNQAIASWNFVYKYVHPTDNEKTRVLEIALKDCRRISSFTRNILKKGDYLRYGVHNCDLRGDRSYLFSHDLFPLAFMEVETGETGLRYSLLDSVESKNYAVPPLRIAKIEVEIAKEGKIAGFKDPVERLIVTQAHKQASIDSGDEADKLLQLVSTIEELDPDIVLTTGGDSYVFPYLIHRATINNVLDKCILSRDRVPFVPKIAHGKAFFSYGRKKQEYS